MTLSPIMIAGASGRPVFRQAAVPYSRRGLEMTSTLTVCLAPSLEASSLKCRQVLPPGSLRKNRTVIM